MFCGKNNGARPEEKGAGVTISRVVEATEESRRKTIAKGESSMKYQETCTDKAGGKEGHPHMVFEGNSTKARKHQRVNFRLKSYSLEKGEEGRSRQVKN